jgi:hypothetical protein
MLGEGRESRREKSLDSLLPPSGGRRAGDEGEATEWLRIRVEKNSVESPHIQGDIYI